MDRYREERKMQLYIDPTVRGMRRFQERYIGIAACRLPIIIRYLAVVRTCSKQSNRVVTVAAGQATHHTVNAVVL